MTILSRPLCRLMLFVFVVIALTTRVVGQLPVTSTFESYSSTCDLEQYKDKINSLLDHETPRTNALAEPIVDQAMLAFPGDDFFFRTKAYLCLQNGSFIAGLKPAEIAYNLDPSLKNATNLAATIAAIAKEDANTVEPSLHNPFARRYYEKGLECAEIMIQSEDRSKDGYVVRGFLHLYFKEYEAAIRDMSHLIKLYEEGNIQIEKGKPNNPYQIRGWAYDGLGQYEKAIADFTIVSEQFGGKRSYEDRAFCYYCLGQWEKARLDYEHMLRFASNEPGPRLAIAMCYDQMGMHDKAVEIARQIAPAFINEPLGNLILGQICLNGGEKHLAQNHLENVIKLSTEGDNLHSAAKLILYRLESNEKDVAGNQEAYKFFLKMR